MAPPPQSTQSIQPTHRYLAGNFAPVRTEQVLTDLKVEGTLPAGLDGRYLRNGPNPVGPVDPAGYHWFLGSGMVHGIRLRDGRAEWYRNRWVRSGEVADALGEPRRPGPVHAEMDFSPNTNVVGHAGRTFAIVEGGSRPYELTDELDTVGPCDFDGTLSGGYTAHPHRDLATGDLHAISYFWGWGDVVQYSVLGRDGRVSRTVDLDVPGGPMMHDFAFTDHHVIVFDLPITFDLDLVARQPFPYAWNPAHPSRVGVFRRDGDGTDLRWFDVAPCYVYHPMNAFEDGTSLVVDVVRYESSMRTDHTGPFEASPTLDRWTIDLNGPSTVAEQTLHDLPSEFPRIDERLTGRRHRFGYSPVSSDPNVEEPEFDGLMRVDTTNGRTQVRSFGPTRRSHEFVFVPTAEDSAEDDGVLMGLVSDVADDTTRLVVLDSATLEDVASVEIPARVPYGFHGNWIPTGQ